MYGTPPRRDRSHEPLRPRRRAREIVRHTPRVHTIYVSIIIYRYFNIAFNIIYYDIIMYRYISIYNCDDNGLGRLSNAILLLLLFLLILLFYTYLNVLNGYTYMALYADISNDLNTK